MRPTLLALLAAAAVAACDGGSSPPPAPDAWVDVDGGAAKDGGGAIDAPAAADAGAAACTGATYDPCTTGTQCLSGVCHAFSGAGLQVCTPMCTPGSACPSQNGVAITCNNMGFCKPPAANNCTR